MSEKHDNGPHPGGGLNKPKSKRTRKPHVSKAGDVGKALRSVYDSTLREEVPGDFLDLLGKLS